MATAKPAVLKTATEEVRDGIVLHTISLLSVANWMRDDLYADIVKSNQLLRRYSADVLDTVLTAPRNTRQLRVQAKQLDSALENIHDQRTQTWQGIEKRAGKFFERLGRYEAHFIINILKDALFPQLPLQKADKKYMEMLLPVLAIEGRRFDEWMDLIRNNDIQRITSSVRSGIARGESSQKIASDIFSGPVGERPRNDLNTMARTFTQGITNEVRNKTYQENRNFFAVVVFVAVLDNRTTDLCRSLDNRVYDVFQAPVPPLHPNCRSVIVPVWNREEIEEEWENRAPKRYAALRDKEKNAKLKEGLTKVTFSEWLAKQPRTVQRRILGDRKYKLYRQGKLDTSKYPDSKTRKITLDTMIQKGE